MSLINFGTLTKFLFVILGDYFRKQILVLNGLVLDGNPERKRTEVLISSQGDD